METATAESPAITRRQLLAAAATVSVGASSGCAQRLRSIANRESPETVSLTVTAPPADSDRRATLIARHLVRNLEAAGIDATLNVLPETELYRAVLLNRDFELFVARLPAVTDPDEYYGLVHSMYATESGWQNPYGFTDIETDNALGRQRRTEEDDRREAVNDLTHSLVNNQPFTTIGYPEEIRAFRTDRFVGWEEHGIRQPLSYLALERSDSVSADEELSLRLAVNDARISQNLNPLSVEFRQAEPFTTLLYDSLARRIEDEIVPWLASDWEFEPNGDTGTVTASLRSGVLWHDDSSMTATDVAFTFEFLSDTALGELAGTVPAPRFRSWTSLVSDVEVPDDTTVRLTVETPSEEVATQALLTPIFPEHIWRGKQEVAEIAGVEGSSNVTEALVWDNNDPVGSGPLQIDDVSSDDEVTFVPFEQHFLVRGGDSLEEIPERFLGEPAFDLLELQMVPGNESAVNSVALDESDGTATGVDPREEVLEAIAEEPSVSMLVEHSPSPYHIGFNTAKQPFGNPYLRQLLARLVDKQYVVSEIFGSHGTPAAHPLDETVWGPTELQFDGEDPVVPFLGSDGEVDEQQAREAFRAHGFQFDDDGKLRIL